MLVLASLVGACTHGSRSPVPSSPFAQRFADAGRCPAASGTGLPPGSGCVTSAKADLDGDGRADRFVVFARLRDGLPLAWWARALLGSDAHPTAARRLPVELAVGGSPEVYPRVAGAAEANGASGAEVFVQLTADQYHSGSRPVEAIFGVRSGRVVPVTAAGHLFTFSTGGISRFGDGARCNSIGGRRVFSLTHIGIEPYGWRWTVHRFTWHGLELVPDGSTEGRLPVISIGSPRVYRFYQLICGGLRLSAVTNSYPPPITSSSRSP